MPWLEPFALAEGQTATVRIASFAMQVQRRAREWRVNTATTSDLGASDVDLRIPDVQPQPLPFMQDAQHARFAFDVATELRLRPRLADRTVVVRPADPLFLMPGATVDIYVSTIIWVALEVAPGGTVLVDRTAHRPSDTWFGPSTREGELAYASRTSARMDPRELPNRPNRATTRIRLANHSKAPRSLARVMLPAPELELWQLPSGMLWTQSIELPLGDSEEAPLKLEPGPPSSDAHGEAATGAALVSPPRRLAQKSLFVRAMSAIF